MSDTNTNVFNTKLIDVNGLSAFWTAAKTYVETYVSTLVEAEATARLNKDNDLAGLIEGNTAAIDNITKANGTIDTKIAALDPADKGASGKYASNVEVKDGKIVVTYNNLPEGADWQGPIDTAKGEAIADAAEKLAAHAAAKYTYDDGEGTVTGDIHLAAREREAWNKAASDIEKFLEGAGFDEDSKKVVDTLKDLQDYIAEHGGAASGMAQAITALEGRADALEGRADALEAKDTELADLISGLESTHATDKAAQANVDKAQDDKIAALESAKTANDTAHTGFTDSIAAINAKLDTMTLAPIDECIAIVTGTTNNQ